MSTCSSILPGEMGRGIWQIQSIGPPSQARTRLSTGAHKTRQVWRDGEARRKVLEALLARCPSNHLAQDPCVGPPGAGYTFPLRLDQLTSAAGAYATGLESAACCSSATYWLYEVQNAMLEFSLVKDQLQKTDTARTQAHTHAHTHICTQAPPNQRPSGPGGPQQQLSVHLLS